MTVIVDPSYGDGGAPLDRARIAHSRNWLSGGTAEGSSTASGFFEDGPLNTLTYEKWKPAGLPAQWIYNHSETAPANYCCIAAHNLGSTGCTLSVQYWNGTNWNIATDNELITTDDPIMVLFDTGADRSRYRIRVDGPELPVVGVVKFGVALNLPVATYAGHVPDQFALETELRTNQSETGEFLGRSVQRRRTSPGYQWEHIPFSWLSANMRDLQAAIEAEPFFVAWRPDGYESISFGYVNSVPQPVSMGILDLYSFGLSMVGYRGAPT